jgi:alkanesulfonate monooxygenase SsuD/methylene tetrahydromethanopterin reductase-like flavin-dependent oxidoreductase (luciferase family)
MFGYELGDIPTRMDSLGEGLAVVTGLLRTEEPLTYEGQFYQLQKAILAGPRRADGPPILVGGSGPRRTLPLVARYADIWNGQQVSPAEYGERSALLDRLLAEVGRQPGEVKRALTLPLFCGRDEAELEQRAGWLRLMNPAWADVPLEAIFEALRPRFKSLTVGTPEAVVERLRAYAAVGVTEVMLQWGGLDDIEGLRVLSEEVLPYLSGKEGGPMTM